jgi:hypothetical protein
MSKKHVRDIAIVIIVVFVATIIVYPLIFGTDVQPADSAPVELEMGK